MTTDLAVVSRARSGDADAFRMLVESHSKAAFRVAYRMTGNEHDADEIVEGKVHLGQRGENPPSHISPHQDDRDAAYGRAVHRVIAVEPPKQGNRNTTSGDTEPGVDQKRGKSRIHLAAAAVAGAAV